MKYLSLSKLAMIFAMGCMTVWSASAQKVQYDSEQFVNIQKLGTVNVGDIEDKYMPHLQSLEAPPVSGNAYKEALAQRKEEIARLYPKNDNKIPSPRSFVSLPEIMSSFPVTNVSRGIPLDNHLAANGDLIVTAGNFFVSINDKDGNQIDKFTLAAFAQQVGVNAQPFDPRLAYDMEQERWVLVFLAGFSSNDTHILLAVSEDSDPTGNWSVYNITGNPNSLNQWTDYPMISLTNDHIFVTINLLLNNQSWQNGFVETIIWEVEKQGAYAGTDLQYVKYDGITYGGQNIRNVCPAESATEEMYDDIYFISDRNFAVTNDTFFLIKLDPAAEPDDKISVQPVISDVPYGAPPFADQYYGKLATNDARVLEAFRLGDHIQFVGNTRNPDNNGAGIFHAVIENAQDPTVAILHHMIGDGYDLGYPGLIYTGMTEGEYDAIITCTHSGDNDFAGISAIYYYPEEGYSDILRVVEGLDYIDVLTFDVLERWGDYMGTHRDQANPGEGWLSSTVGGESRDAVPYVAQLRRPLEPTGLTEPKGMSIAYNIHPNPASDRISMEFSIPEGLSSLSVDLYSIDGRRLETIYQSAHLKVGKHTFSFNTDHLNAAPYMIQITADGQTILAEQIIKL